MRAKDLIAIGFVSVLLAGTSVAFADEMAAMPGMSPTAMATATLKAKPTKKMRAKVRAQAKAKAQVISLSVTEDGFVPADIKLKKGVAYSLVVTRQTDKTCATQISIPDYAEATDLPLNVPVTIALLPKAAGEIHYSCGMGMLHGVLSVE